MNNWFKVNVNEVLCTGLSNSELGIMIRYKALCEHFGVENLTWQKIEFNFDCKERKVVSKLFGILPEVSPDMNQSLPEVEPKLVGSLTEVSPKFTRSSPEVCPKKSNRIKDLKNPYNIYNIFNNPIQDKTRQDKTIPPYVPPTGETTPKQKKFVKPTLEEVQAYCQERGNSVDAHRWLDYYESNGWKVGKNPMKDWRAAVRTWERGTVAGGGTNTEKRDERGLREIVW